ncbi:hypothetical protein [Paenibacillus pedocola]|uniref:hypothetical protein n=1 Tax=Paenibacillus pedocola TaxID=3242193 RepID=UPI0028775E01|nr:hypothetical protein [Paenibacillus typhae]
MNLRHQLESYRDKDELLHSFKICTINAFDTKYDTDKQFANHYLDDESQEDFRWDFLEFSVHSMVLIMNALGLEISKFDRIEQFSYEAQEPYYAYRFIEIWDFLKQQSPFEFLVAMATVSQKGNPNYYSQKNMNILNEIITDQLDIHEIILENKIQKSIFIAMSFNKDMRSAREAIIRAINKCKYIPVLIDIKEHNNFIVPEIFIELQKSTMVIADITQQKTGVYLEAGYAMGLKKPVILSCNEEDFGNKHFDVAQINTIVWSNADDLEQRLIQRIKAVEYQSRNN